MSFCHYRILTQRMFHKEIYTKSISRESPSPESVSSFMICWTKQSQSPPPVSTSSSSKVKDLKMKSSESQELSNQLENYQALLWWIFQPGKFMGKGNNLSYIDILKWLIKKLINLCQKPSNSAEFRIVLSSCVLRFRTPSGKSARTHSFCHGVICQV